MRIKHFFFALVAMLICSVSSVFAQVAKIGDTEYATLQAAMTEANKAAGNYTITLLNNSTEVFTFAQKSGVNITIDGDGNTFSGKITLNAGGGNLTFTDAKIAPANSQTIYLSVSTAPNVTFDGCTLQGANKSGTIIYCYASATSNALKVKNCTADNLQYIISHRQTGASSVLVENVTASNMIYLVRTLKCPSVTVKNVTVSDAVIGIDIKNDAAGGKLTLEDVNINIVTYNGSVYAPVSGSGAGKSWTVEFKGNNTFSANGVAYTDNSWFSGNAGYVIKDANVAKIGDKLYYDFATAFDAAQPGQTIVLLADYTGEPVTLAEGVKLDANGKDASKITVQVPNYVAQIGEQGYETLAEAFAAANAAAGDYTITLLDNNAEVFTFAQKEGVNITVDGEGKTFTGKITLNAGAGSLTFTDMTLTPSNADAKSIVLNASTAPNVTIDGCTMKNTGTKGAIVWGLASSTSNKVVIKNSTASNLQYLVGTNQSGCEDVTVENVTATNMAYLVRSMKAAKVTVKDVTYSGLTFVQVKNSNECTLAIENVTVTTTQAGMPPITMLAPDSGNGAMYTITLKGENTANGAEMTKVNESDWFATAAAGLPYKIINLNAVAMIGEQGYESFDDAYKAAKKGDVITLLETVVIDGGYWVNYSKKEITVKANFGDVAFRVQGNPGMVWFGGMTIESDDYCIIVGAKDGSTGADVDIYGGTYIGATTAISVTKGSVKIQGGTFKVEPYEGSYEYTINCVDANYKAGTAKVTIDGGKFYNFNPADCAAEGAGTNFLSAGKLAAMGEDGYYNVVDGEAKVNGVNYLTLKEAIAAAQAGDVVELCNNVKTNEIITIDKPITLNGWGRSLTSTAGRAINVSGANGVTIKKLTINASGERAINVIQNATNVTIEEVTATAANYTVNIAGSAPNAVVAINNSTLNGLCTVNVAAAGANVTVDNSTVNCNDNNTTEGEAYAALCLNKEAVGGSIVATNTTVNVAEGSDSAKGRNGAEDGTVTINGSAEGVAVMVAAITYPGSDYYHSFASLAKAVEFAKAGDVITLIRDVTGAGVVINKNVTIDFNGKTYTANVGVGSTGTETLALQILKGDVVLKNGTLTSEGANIKMLINNYTNLNVDNMKLVDDTDAIQYVLSNNSGTVNIVNGSEITANGAIALDACKYASYAAPTVNVAEGVTVNGNVEVSATLNMNGTLNGAIVINGAEGVVNGAEGLNVSTTVGADYKVAYADGKYTVVEKNYVAQVGEAKYEKLAEAVAAGGEVTFLADINENVTLAKNVTINGAGKNYTGTMTVNNVTATIQNVAFVKGQVYKHKSTGSAAVITIKDCTFDGQGLNAYAVNVGNGKSLAIENVTATNYGYGLLQVPSSFSSISVKNVEVSGCYYGFKVDYAGAVAFEDVTVADDVTIGIYDSNYGDKTYTIKNSEISSISIWERPTAKTTTFKFEGLNKVTSFTTSQYAKVVAEAKSSNNYYGDLAAVVAATQDGVTVELLADVTLEGGNEMDAEAGLVIDKAITFEGNGHTIDCGTFVKGIRIYGHSNLTDIKINNVTVVNNNVYGRCVDTRKGYLRLKFNNAKLVATNGNSQPLTVGGNEQLHQIDLSGCTIDAGNSGYAIISFVPTNQAIKIMNSTVTGYAGIYLKGDGTKVTITTNSKVIGKNVHTGETNGFGAVVIEGNNNTVNINATSPMLKAVAEGGAEQAAILIKSGTGNKVVLETSKGANIVAEGENAYWAMINEAAEATITKNGAEVALVADANGWQFASLEEAVRFAKNGGEIKLLSDIALDTKTLVTDCDGYSSIINVEDMELTFDLNGKTITVDAAAADLADAKSKMLLSVFSVDEGGKLTINDSSEDKTGAVVVNANDATVYSVVTNYTDGAYTTINGGKFIADKVYDSMIYSGAHQAVIVNDGYYHLGNLGTPEVQNGKPWIFNVLGANERDLFVNGGTFNADINHQYWAFEIVVPETRALRNNGDGTWTMVDAAAWVYEPLKKYKRAVGYATLEEAIAVENKFENTVNLAKNVEIENMITVANGETLVLNLNGKTLAAIDKTTKNYSAIDNRGTLTIVDSSEDGKITVEATVNSGWGRYSAVIANNPGGKLTVNGGTIEHLGGTDMAYGIDNLTNGKGTYAETEINGGVIKSTYRAVRQFLNGVEAQNILTINGGTIVGANKSIFFHDPSKNANTGNLSVGEDAVLNGDVYLYVTAGSTEWPVEVYVDKAALGENEILSANVPAEAAALVEYDTFWQVEQKKLAELTIVDEQYAEYINKVEKSVAKLTYVRDFENTEWQTIYLPFEVPVEALTAAGLEAAYIYNASYKNGEARIDHVEMTEGSLAANYPYMIRAKEAGEKVIVVENAVLEVTKDVTIDCSSVFEKFTFTGNYAALEADDLASSNKVKNFVLEDGVYSELEFVGAFRFYLTIEKRQGEFPAEVQPIRMRTVNANGEETTGIDGVDAEQAGDFIFDLHGRRVLETEKGGIYIKGGKKFIAQ